METGRQGTQFTRECDTAKSLKGGADTERERERERASVHFETGTHSDYVPLNGLAGFVFCFEVKKLSTKACDLANNSVASWIRNFNFS